MRKMKAFFDTEDLRKILSFRMQELKEQDLKLIVGGISISGTIINLFVRAIEAALEIGRSFGTFVRRLVDLVKC